MKKAPVITAMLLGLTFACASCAKDDGPAFEGLRAGMRMEEVEEAWDISLADWTEEDDPETLIRSFYYPGESFTLPESGSAVEEVGLEFAYDFRDTEQPVGLKRVVFSVGDVSASQEYCNQLVEEYGEPAPTGLDEGSSVVCEYPPEESAFSIQYRPPGWLPSQPLYTFFRHLSRIPIIPRNMTTTRCPAGRTTPRTNKIPSRPNRGREGISVTSGRSAGKSTRSRPL